MKTKPPYILIVDDESKVCRKLEAYFKGIGFVTFTSENATNALEKLEKIEFDFCFLDVILPGMGGIELLKRMRELNPNMEVIMMSGYGDMDMVIDALRYGALDFIRKPFHFHDLEFSIARTRRIREMQQKLEGIEDLNSLISRELEIGTEKKLIGSSDQIKQVLDLATLAGKDNEINVLITGENGTGKEIIARVIHYSSARKTKNFCAVNSTAVPETLLESEFFGHRKGSFTDAREDKKGFFELADGGTLFLDEIADMPLPLQSKLLRAIEEKQIRPIGHDKLINVDTRIICATNKNLNKMISENLFREDLYHRINALIIHVPALRERPADIEPLVHHFARFFSRRKNKPLPEISSDLIENLKRYSFPGNVRELKNMVERALLVSDYRKLEMDSVFISSPMGPPNVSNTPESLNLNENEKKFIEAALQKAIYNQRTAAQFLGISRDSLIRRMKKYHIKIRRKLDEK